jgi:Leucine-rich repeat (LRR) protein
LKNLNELNLNGNPIEDIKAATESIKTIGQALKSLNINLYEEDQVDYLLRNIEWLEILNGLKVERDALFNNEDDESGDSNR